MRGSKENRSQKMDNWKIVLTNQMPITRKSNKHDENQTQVFDFFFFGLQ